MRALRYLAAFILPAVAFYSIGKSGAYLFLTPIVAFVVIPVLEILLPLDDTNISENEYKTLLENKTFDWLLYLNIPIVYGLVVYTLYNFTTVTYSTTEIIGLVLSTGIVLGANGINVAHELGHRNTFTEKLLAKILLIPSQYMHFYIEHNFGHHVHAATNEDGASARLNQSVYSFWVTSITKQYINAWRIQKRLLQQKQVSFFSLYNDMLWYTVLQSLYLITIYMVFGFFGVLIALAIAVTGILLLETINYIEHYGLRRLKKPSGRYERVKEIHSWNSNHIVGRLVLYELTRHSDHHYKASKKYQVLENHTTSPQLPFGYPTSMVLALFPPLWFYIMNPRIPEQMKTTQS